MIIFSVSDSQLLGIRHIKSQALEAKNGSTQQSGGGEWEFFDLPKRAEDYYGESAFHLRIMTFPDLVTKPIPVHACPESPVCC